MANKVGRGPRLPRPVTGRAPTARQLSKYDAAQNSANYRQQVDVAQRLNLAIPYDGSEAFQAPVPAQNVATVDLPTVADWEGGIVYDSTTSELRFSDGSNWMTVVTTTGSQTLTNKTFSGISISGTTQQNVTLTTPIITNPVVTGTLTLSGGLIAFPATQVASTGANVLDDYEEGTWTPTLVAAGGTFNYATREGFYQKIGRIVTVWCKIILASGGTLVAQPITMSGLPFTVATGAGTGVCDLLFDNTTTSYVEVHAFAAAGTTTVSFGFHTAAGTTNINVPNANGLCSSGGTLLAFQMSYPTTD